MTRAQKTKAAEEPRAIDPKVIQRRAAMPDTSIWASASAGTGKTTVLTDRVLRLLLPRTEGPGTAPHRVLCLTFTKAAASEMALRIGNTLSRWAVAAQEKLEEELQALLGRASSPEEQKAARRLFAEVADAPGGLNIMTIHSFCTSLLGRFPLEAGLSPHFIELDERQADALLTQARDSVLGNAAQASPVHQAAISVAAAAGEDRFFDLLKAVIAERGQLQKLLAQNFGIDGLYARLCTVLGVQQNRTPADILKSACESGFDEAGLRSACAALAEGSEKEQGYAVSIQQWLDSPVEGRIKTFKTYEGIFLTTENTPRASGFPTKLTERRYPDCVFILRGESQRLLELQEAMNASNCAVMTRDLLLLGHAILEEYTDLKKQRGALDFDDLILTTLDLLRRQEGMAGWVMYKLDQGLDHILIDEAQDTNPEQWEIVKLLAREFFTGEGAREAKRTVFTVGDEKQSIYSFQRAAPQEFHASRLELKSMVENAQEKWDDVPLNISFRSTQAVLDVVDSTFADFKTHHISHRRGQAGLVELWPVCESEKSGEVQPWELPVKIVESHSGASLLAGKIARQIKAWLESGESLPARGRALRPEDILILVRTRNAFVNQLSKALKSEGIPVSGTDRMILNDQLPVRDMLALAEFAMLPSDDLTLAAILKSPVIGWDEEKLYQLAVDRKGTLWDALRGSKHKAETSYLETLIREAGAVHPYEFLAHILQRPCPADAGSALRAFRSRLGPDVTDPLEELLNAALGYERDNIPSLQGFLHWQARENGTIRRELEQPQGQVRIMTVHGAKGLQAPVVILPDTIRSGGGNNKAGERLLWPDKSGLPVPLWSPRSDDDCQAYTRAAEKIAALQEEEYNRLLYVAMTRAEDRLYICGHKGPKTAQPQSWYFKAQAGLQALEETEEAEDGIIRLSHPQTRDPDRPDKKRAVEIQTTAPPEWLRRPAPPEPSPPRPLAPSRPSESEAASSPVSGESPYRFRRGNLTHKLLQYLPDLPVPTREQAARDFIAREGTGLNAEIRGSIVSETLAILNHPEFAAIFGPGSQAEVPVTGMVGEGHVISGQIDRLLVTDKEILIIDYKTNRPPPLDVKDVPALYRRQMQAYATALSLIYPGRAVRTALLWTDGPSLMRLDL